MFCLSGKTVIVTGANGKLGTYLCEELYKHKASVVKIDISYRHNRVDIANYKDIKNFISGSKINKIYGLINNAAANFKGKKVSEEQVNKMIDVNIKGTKYCTELFAQKMINGASVVNIASIYGIVSPDFRIYDSNEEQYSNVMYGATKAAIIQMTKYYSVLFAKKKIRVNCISPGGIFQNQNKNFVTKYTHRVPSEKMITHEEVSNVALFLLSNLSSGINGQNIVCDGGLTVW